MHAQPPHHNLQWRWQAFDALSVHELQGIHRARQSVFVVDQGSLYADADAHDTRAHHLSAWTPDQSMPVAYARLLEPGTRYAEPALGRVLTLPSVRRQGLGTMLVQRALRHATAHYPGQKIRISAQAHLVNFYSAMGFEVVGTTYLDAGIAHVEMLLRTPLM